MRDGVPRVRSRRFGDRPINAAESTAAYAWSCSAPVSGASTAARKPAPLNCVLADTSVVSTRCAPAGATPTSAAVATTATARRTPTVTERLLTGATIPAREEHRTGAPPQ